MVLTCFLLLQIWIPLRYYLMGGGDDERFSWRMFSTTRLDRCRVRLYTLQLETRRRRRIKDVRQDVQAAWVHMLERNRPQVVERYLERRCEAVDGSAPEAVQFVRACRRTDGTRKEQQKLTMHCRDKVLTAPVARWIL